MFGITSYNELPEEYIIDYAKWDTYMAQVWHALLTSLKISPDMTVIEIAPGSSAKIGLALQQSNFRGTFYVVEPAPALLASVCTTYHELLPQAQIIPVNTTLLDSIELLPHHADFLLANHPLDDMLIAYHYQAGIFDWAINPTNDLSPSLVNAWSALSADLNGLRVSKTHIVAQWRKVFKARQPLNTIISQYRSITLDQHQLQSINDHANDILTRLKDEFSLEENRYGQLQKALNQLENYNNKHIALEILNIKNWFVTIICK